MKQIITLTLVLFISFTSFAQKKELKAAKKAIAGTNYSGAITSLKMAKPLLDGAKEKYKIEYYYLLGKAIYATGKDVSKYDATMEAFNTLLKLENNPKAKYSVEANNIILDIKNSIYQDAVADYKRAAVDFKENPELANPLYEEASIKFNKVYEISKHTDTIALFQSARASFYGKKHEKAIEVSNQLLELGFTGAGTQYSATSVVNGATEYFPTKEDMDKKVAMKLFTDPKTSVFESQRGFIHKMIINAYRGLEQNEKALEAVGRAKEESPNDYGLLVDEANVYYAMGNKEMFKSKLEEAIKINDTDASLFFNIGVMKAELGDNKGAIESYKKAIEIDPKYFDAYNNIGAAVLEDAAAIVEEMNNTTNDAKYDQLQKQQEDVYRNAMPYYEKAFQLNNEAISVVQTLMGIYYNLEMDDKAKEMKTIYDSLKD